MPLEDSAINPHPLYERLLEASHGGFQKKIAKICQPLRDFFHVDVFFYSNIRENGSSLHLCTRPEMLEDYLYSGYLLTCPLHSRFHYTMTPAIKILGPTNENNAELNLIYQYYAKHHLVSGITLTVYKKNYREMYYFGVHALPNLGQDYWYNLIPALYDFIEFFSTEAKLILQQAEEHSIFLPEIIGDIFYETKNKDKYFSADVLAEKNNFRNKLLEFSLQSKGLTDRELSILPGCLAGKTSKQIAEELCISYRTVQNNIQQIKEKFNCRSQRQISALFVNFFGHPV